MTWTLESRELLEYWHMSHAYQHTRYKRMLWTADKIQKRYPDMPHRRIYKALELVLKHRTVVEGRIDAS